MEDRRAIVILVGNVEGRHCEKICSSISWDAASLPKDGVSSAAPLMLAALPDEAAQGPTWLIRQGYIRQVLVPHWQTITMCPCAFVPHHKNIDWSLAFGTWDLEAQLSGAKDSSLTVRSSSTLRQMLRVRFHSQYVLISLGVRESEVLKIHEFH